MSYFDDYIAEGLCCEQCGAAIDMDEPGFVRVCAGCEPRKPVTTPKRRSNKRGKRRK